MDTIDLIDFHPFPIDTPGDKAVKLNNLLQYCGIDSHNNFNKYEEWPNIRSIRPSDDVKEENNEQAVRLREKYDRIMLAIANKEFEELEAEFPTRYSQFKNNRVELQAILESLFGYEGLQWI